MKKSRRKNICDVFVCGGRALRHNFARISCESCNRELNNLQRKHSKELLYFAAIFPMKCIKRYGNNFIDVFSFRIFHFICLE